MKTLLLRLPRRTLLSATLLLSLAACGYPPPPAESVA